MPGESKKISELESASSLNNGDLIELASVNALSETGYSSKKTTIEDVAGKVATLNPQAQADWTEADTTDPSYIQNKPTLATVATSGSYNDLSNQPTIPAAQVNSDWNSSSGVSEILNKPTLGTSASKDVGVANGVAGLDANGLVPTSQLPAYVDDVLEYASQSAFPATGETGKIYVALDTNLTYRWGGTEYVEISPSLALGETSSTAYAGNKGKANADAISAIQTTLSGLATVATTGDYDDLIDKPTIPTVNNATVTFTQGGTTKGSITLNQSTDATIALDAGGSGGASALDDLSDVTITNPTAGQVLYFDGSEWINHEGGGSGGGSAQIDTLYSGTAVSGDVVTLSSAYTNYDMLIFKCYNTDMTGYFGSSWSTSSLTINDSILVGYGTINQSSRRLIGIITSTTTFSVTASENGTQLKEIVGYKFGRGSNSVELTYAEYQALTPEQQLDGTEYFITDINGDGQQFQPIIYSEEEREIGVWVDGKPLYEKTLVTNTPTAVTGNAWAVIPWENEPTNIETLVNAQMTGVCPNVWYTVRFSFENGHICAASVSNANFPESNVDTYVVIQYTKSTDTAGSGTWTPQGVPAHHYSTDEQVVGTWVDGNTLYEKTLIFNNVQVTQSDSTSGLVHNVSNIGSFKRVTEAYVDFSGGQNWIPATDAITISTNDYVVTWAVGNTSIALVYKGELSLDASVNRSYLFTIQYTKSST